MGKPQKYSTEQFLRHVMSSKMLFNKWKFAKHLLIKSNEYENKLSLLCGLVMSYTISLIMKDIVNNNITFQFPSKDSFFEMRTFSGDDFWVRYNSGVLYTLNLDYVISGEKVYLLCWKKVIKNIITKFLPIYPTYTVRDLIIENTNKGMTYG